MMPRNHAAMLAITLGLMSGPAAAQAQAGTPPDPATWSYWESGDGAFTLDLFGAMQALYQLRVPDGNLNRTVLGSDYAAEPATETSLFRIRRARLGAEGRIWGHDLRYHVQLELAGSSAALKRIYVNWAPGGAAFQVQAGKFKVPFGRQQLTSFTRQLLVDRAIASDEFARGEDDGLMVWGRPFGGGVEWYLGVFNGEGNNRNSQQDGQNLWAGRVVVAPLGPVGYSGTARSVSASPRLALGLAGSVNGGWLHDVNGVPGVQAPQETCVAGRCTVDTGDDASVRQGSVELAATWSRVAVSGEYFRRRIAPRAGSLSDVEADGWYAQAGIMVRPDRLEFGARYSELDRDLDRAGDVREVGPSATWYVHGDDLKLQADALRLTTRLGDFEVTERSLRVSLVAQF